MTIEIVRRGGVDHFERVAVWDEDEGWIEGEDEYSFPDDHHYDEELMLGRFDGPNLFARPLEGEEEEKNSQSIGPTQATLLGVGRDVETVEEPDREETDAEQAEDREEEDSGKEESSPVWVRDEEDDQ